MQAASDAQFAEEHGARAAVTRFAPVERRGGFTLLEVEIPTGVMHQIRAHLAFIGHPLAGDALYGGPDLPGLSRHFLHASRLAQRLAHDSGWDQEDILALVDILRNDTALTPVLNWRLWGAERLSKLLSGQVADDVCTEPQPSAQEAPDTGADAAIQPARTPAVSSSAA